MNIAFKPKKTWDSFWAWLLAYPISWLKRRPNTWLGNNAANVVTVSRGIIMTPLVFGLASAEPEQRGPWLIAIFFLQLTDGADGAIARGTGKTSPLGSTLDGGVDKYSALLLLGGLIAWIRPEFSTAASWSYAVVIMMILLAEAMCISINNDRLKLCDQLSKKFSSRLPAQIKFLVSMLILGSCWLASDRQASAFIFASGIVVILLLTIWSLIDYANDRIELEWELGSP